MALEVEPHAGLEAGAAHERLVHPHHFRPLDVHGGGVEVVDLAVAVGAHRMGHRAAVLGELQCAQHAHVLDPADRARRRAAGHVHRELLVPEDRQSLLQRELEPVAASDAIAGPVVEVLVGDDGLDGREVGVGRGGRRREQRAGVEDVESLVLHRARIEVGHAHHHEAFQIQRQAETRLVPSDRRDKAVHRVHRLVEVAATHVRLQQVLLAGGAAQRAFAHDQVARDEREQIAGLRKRIRPDRDVPAVVQVAAADEVAVGQQDGKARLVCAQRHRVDGHHVGSVLEIRDAAKALRLALREEASAGGVEARQRGVRVGRAAVEDLEREVRVRRGVDDELVAVLVRGDGRAVDQYAQQRQLLAVQAQRAMGGRAVALDAHRAGDERAGGVEVEGEIDVPDPERGRPVVGAVDDRCKGVAHESFLS